MMKVKALQQKLTKTAIISVVVVSALSAGAYGVYAWSDSLNEDLTKTEKELRSIRSDLDVREQKVAEADKYMDLYQMLTGSEEQAKLSDLNRDKAQQWISATAAKYQITNLTGNFDPVANIENPDFQRKTIQGITSKVSLNFAAMTDEQLYRFVNEIGRDFPGYVKITRVSFEKKGEIEDSTLLAAGRGSFPELVTCTMDFYWIAIKKNASDKKPAQGGEG